MDNIYMLEKGESVVISAIDETSIDRFDLSKDNKKILLGFLNKNLGKSFKVKDVFGNKILLENDVFVFDFNIVPDRDILFKFTSIRSQFCMEVTKDMLEKIKKSNIEIKYGFGLDFDQENRLILPYDSSLLDYNLLKAGLSGYLQVQNMQNQIALCLK